ncbi:MAG TPA: VWA domain-containing protein [Candidatus Acidoferrales bacterium]|nr:VWA domain-containing protein [Candidatus Acidoferrales bacterium]
MTRFLPLFFLMAAQYASGQADTSGPDFKFSVDVNLVVLHATVRDRKGRFVSGLRKDDFQIFENGVPQAIREFQHEDVPVAVGLVVDNSGSMSRKRRDVTAAALAFARSSNPNDQMFVVNFNERVCFGLRGAELFSASTAELEHALNGVPANGRTALYDAIEVGLAHLNKASLEKKVLIVISDGGDNASHHALDQVLEIAGRSDAIIYTIGLFDEDDKDRNPGVLKKLARVTGGEVYLPSETGRVVQVCQAIAADIRNQYTFSYFPSNQKLDGTFRGIRVTATAPHGGRLLVRTRDGYIASPQRKVRPNDSRGGP